MCCEKESDLEWLIDVGGREGLVTVRLTHLPTNKTVTYGRFRDESILDLKRRALSALSALVRGESSNP